MVNIHDVIILASHVHKTVHEASVTPNRKLCKIQNLQTRNREIVAVMATAAAAAAPTFKLYLVSCCAGHGTNAVRGSVYQVSSDNSCGSPRELNIRRRGYRAACVSCCRAQCTHALYSQTDMTMWKKSCQLWAVHLASVICAAT